ncbi:MAG: TonB-dependent receptor domain-containing protein [Bryobacteraceae bacterium]
MSISSLPLRAQIDMGGVAGTVKDPTAALVPGAELTLTNEATGVAQKARSSSSGTYVFEAVPVGSYALKVEAPGFKTYLVTGIQIHVQNVVTADISLAVGAVSEVLTVSSALPLLQAQDASLGQTIASRPVNELPLNGRNWLSLTQLSAGSYLVGGSVSTIPSPSGQNFTGSIFTNGAEPGQLDFRLNGVNNNEEVFGGVTVVPVPDAIEEFKLQSGDNSAEFGHSIGAVINAVMKSGTNQIKGDLWEFLRNEDFNANDYFSNLNGVRRQEYRQNQFGGTIGGPVYIPKYYNGKNRTFFFFDYQRSKTVAPITFTDTIPANSMRSSNFTNLQDLISRNSGTETDALGRKFPLGTVFDPATTRALPSGATDPATGLVNSGSNTVYARDPFYNGSLRGMTDFTHAMTQLNLIPVSRIDPNAVKLLQLLPAPSTTSLQNNYFAAPLQNTAINQYDVKIDHNISAKDIVFGVLSRATTDQSATQPFSAALGSALQTSFATTQPVYLLALSETHLFSPTLVNEARVGLNHNYNTRAIPNLDMLGLPAQYGIQGIPQIAHNGGLPTINIGGFNAFGSRRFSPTLQTTTAQDYSNNLTLIRGSHQFKAGFQLNRIVGDITQPAYSRGNFTYNGQYTDIPNQTTGLTGIADFLLIPANSTAGRSAGVTTYDNLGGPSGYNGSNYAGTNYSSTYAGIYAQDNWKLTPNLTLNLGLRWDYSSPYSEAGGRQANFIMANGNDGTGTYYVPQKGCTVPRSSAFNALLASYNIQVDCVPGLHVYNAQTTNFAPRLGFAYRLRPRFVIRAGYGIAYGAFDSVGYGNTLGTNYPFQYTINSPSTTSLVPITLPNGQTATLENTFGAINLQDPNQITGPGLSLSGKQYDYQTPYTQSMNLTIQYQFTGRDSIQAGYVATAGGHLDALGVHNSPSVILPPSVNQTNYRPFPNLAANSQYLTTGSKSNYRSLQTVYQHQFRDGFTLLANYTFGKCQANDAGKSGLSSGFRAEWLPGFGISPDYALCTADATHVVHVSGQYALPIGKGKALLGNAGGLVNALTGGWHVNYIYTYQGGQPFNVGCPVATTTDFGCNAFGVPGQDPYAGPHNQTQWLNAAAFAQPPVATQVGQRDYSVLGGQPNQVRGPAFINLDSSIFKRFAIGEKRDLEFRAEAFNTFNTPQFGNPGQLNFNNKTGFSRITGLRNNPRLVQLALKFFF